MLHAAVVHAIDGTERIRWYLATLLTTTPVPPAPVAIPGHIESEWINSYQRIAHYIGIGIQASAEANWIRLQIPAAERVVRTESVVMQASLFIEVLARKYFARRES